MDATTLAGARWSTSSFGADTGPSTHELSTLCDHLYLCRPARGRLFAMQCGAETLHRFVAARFVTSLFVAVLLIGIGLLAT
jgi:hypothetical protein